MRRAGRQLVATGIGAALLSLAAGCQRPSAAVPRSEQSDAAAAEPAVRTVKPMRQTVRHPIEQPGFNIEAYQETPLYAKVSGYARASNIDIGDSVHPGQVLAELDVPEMKVELKQKEAAVRQATAQVQQTRAAVLTAQAQVERAKSQSERLARIGQGGVLDRESVEESRLGYQAAQANLEKAKADEAVAEAQVEGAQANRDYAQTMLHYTQLRAPFAGVVTQRNVNTGDFVQPAASGAKGRPLFVVDQVDPVRVFVNVPGAEAVWVNDGDAVSLQLYGAGGEVFKGRVTRNAHSLDPLSRTLRTEIDLPNPSHKLLPGMYVQATIRVEHANVWTLPAAAVATQGDQTFCYRVENGKAVRTPLQIGLSGGGLVEVLKKQARAGAPGEEAPWEAITGQEEVAADDLDALSDGQAMRRSADNK